jgi:hypothetical protein
MPQHRKSKAKFRRGPRKERSRKPPSRKRAERGPDQVFTHQQKLFLHKAIHQAEQAVVNHVNSQRLSGDMTPFVSRAPVVINEKKYLMTGSSGACTVSPAWISCTDVPQGTTDSSRIGDNIRIRSIHLKLEFVKNIAMVGVVDYCRIMVIQTHSQFSVAPPTNSQLFLNDPIAAAIDYRSEWIVDGRSTFTVLYDHVITLPGIPTNDKAAFRREFFAPVRRAKKQIQFINASTTDAAGKIFIGVCSNLSATNIPNYAWTTKFNYDDY